MSGQLDHSCRDGTWVEILCDIPGNPPGLRGYVGCIERISPDRRSALVYVHHIVSQRLWFSAWMLKRKD